MIMTKKLWRALDFEWSEEAKCWWSPTTTLSFAGRKTLREVVDGLLADQERQARWLGKNDVRKAMRDALGIH